MLSNDVQTRDPEQAAALILKMLYKEKFMHHTEVKHPSGDLLTDDELDDNQRGSTSQGSSSAPGRDSSGSDVRSLNY